MRNGVIIVIMHKLRQDYNPISRYISEYALGKYGQLASSSFIIYGLSILGIYIGLCQVLHSKIGLSKGLTLIAIWGMSKIIIAFLKVDFKDQKLTIQGTVHSIASIIEVASYALADGNLTTPVKKYLFGNALQTKEVFVLGGTSVVPDTILDQVGWFIFGDSVY